MTLRGEELATAAAHRMPSSEKWPLIRLATGASLGAFFAVLTLLGDARNSDLDASAVASVNDTPLELAEYQRAVQLFGSEKRDAVTQGDRSLILERMIEEELLVQYGVESGLVRRSRAVRTEVLRSVIANLTTELVASAVEGDDGGDDGYDHGQARDDRLVEYLGHLRESATIQWVSSMVEQ